MDDDTSLSPDRLVTKRPFDTTNLAAELPPGAEVQLSNTDLSTDLAPEAETTQFTDDMSGHSPEEEGSLWKSVCDDDNSTVDELGTASDCENSTMSRIFPFNISESLFNGYSTDEDSRLSWRGAILENLQTISYDGVAEELRRQLEQERLRNSANEEERNRLILEVEELRTALSCREKELLQHEEDSKSATERLSRLTMESGAAAEKMELYVRELEDLQQALKEKEATADDLYQQLQLKERQSSAFEDMIKSQSAIINQLKNKNELQSTQILKLESDVLEGVALMKDTRDRMNSFEEDHQVLLSWKTNAVSKLAHLEDENNKLNVALAERKSVFDGMEAEFLESVNKNAEALVHLKYEGDLTKKLLSEKTAEAEALKAQLSSLLQATAELEEEKSTANELLLDKAAMIEALEKDKGSAESLMLEKMATIDALTLDLAAERKEKLEKAENLSRMALEKEQLEKELQETRRSAVNVISSVAPVNAAEVTDLEIKIDELTWRLAQKTAEVERAWKACDDLELSEADYKKRIGQLLDQIEEYKMRCGEESSPGLLDVLRPESEQPLSPYNSKSDSLNNTKNVTMKESTGGSQSFPDGPSPSMKTDTPNCQHQ